MINIVSLGDYKFKYSYMEYNDEIGYVIIEDALDIINIIDVYVDENMRRQGIASKLFKKIISDYEIRNVKFMLEVREDNIPAIILYKRLGFKVIHVREKYYKDSNALIMERVR